MLAVCCGWGLEVASFRFSQQPCLYPQKQTLPKPVLQCTEPGGKQATWINGAQGCGGPGRLTGGRIVLICNQSSSGLLLLAQGHRYISVLQDPHRTPPTAMCFLGSAPSIFQSPRGCLQDSLPITPNLAELGPHRLFYQDALQDQH